MHAPKALEPIDREFLVVCLCADWCGTCRDYEPGFRDLALQYQDVGFIWIDIEDESSGVQDWDIESFPTVLIQRNDLVLFFGPMLPHHRILKQTLDVYLRQDIDEATIYANGTAERAAWQIENVFPRSRYR